MNKPVPKKRRHTPPPVSEEFLSGCVSEGVDDETMELTREGRAGRVTEPLLRSLQQRLRLIPPAKPLGEEKIVKTAGVCGGDACIRDTRLTVWGLEEWRRSGWSNARILANYPQ